MVQKRNPFSKERTRRNTIKRIKTIEGSLFVNSKKYDNLCFTERENIIQSYNVYKEYIGNNNHSPMGESCLP